MAANALFNSLVRYNEPMVNKNLRKLFRISRKEKSDLKQKLIENAKQKEISNIEIFPKIMESHFNITKENQLTNLNSIYDSFKSSNKEIQGPDFLKIFLILPNLIQNPINYNFSFDENKTEFKQIPPWKDYFYLNFEMKKIRLSSIANECSVEQRNMMKFIFGNDLIKDIEISCFSYADDIFQWIRTHSSLTYGYIKSSLNFFNNLENLGKV